MCSINSNVFLSEDDEQIYIKTAEEKVVCSEFVYKKVQMNNEKITVKVETKIYRPRVNSWKRGLTSTEGKNFSRVDDRTNKYIVLLATSAW